MSTIGTMQYCIHIYYTHRHLAWKMKNQIKNASMMSLGINNGGRMKHYYYYQAGMCSVNTVYVQCDRYVRTRIYSYLAWIAC